MKKGDIVKIYEDPITKEKPEGQAKLINRISRSGNKVARFETWEVKFLSDGYITERTIGDNK